jgi:hypothetical protein
VEERRKLTITRINTTRIAHRINRRQSRRSLRRRSRQRIANPSQHNHISRIYTRNHQHHCEIPRTSSCRRGGNNEGRNTKPKRDRDVEVALTRTIGMPGIEECGTDAEDVRWCGEEEGNDVVIAESLDDGGKEIRNSAGGDDAEEHDHLKSRNLSKNVYNWDGKEHIQGYTSLDP